MELYGVRPAEVVFKKKLFAPEFAEIFLVVVRGQQCVMKGHYGEPGICDQGIVPQFFGTMDKFDPKPCQPHLCTFVNDEYPPSAIFLEYIPNLEMLDLNNYTQAQMNKFLVGVHEIHKALVEHARNMLIVRDDPERVVWIDVS
ncbi:hypothetical protein VTO42DRAFT_4956 [Malbranchea cinnamomea]